MIPTSTARTAAIAAALLLATGCEKSPEKTPETTGDPAAQQTDVAPDPADEMHQAGAARARVPDQATATQPSAGTPAPEVTLLSPGAEPRKELRYRIAAGARDQLDMTMKMAMAMHIDGTKAPAVKLPATHTVMDLEVTDASAAGFSYKFAITDAKPMPGDGVSPMLIQTLESQLGGLVGVGGKGTVDNRGFNLGASFELPGTVPPQVAQMMDGMRDAVARMAAPLPAEPIGVGGKWQVEQTMVQNGMTTALSYTYEVTALSGDRVDARVTVALKGVPGPVVNPQLPPGTKMNLDAMTGEGSGTVSLLLTRLVPVESSVAMNSDSAMTVEALGRTQHIKTRTDVEIAIAGGR